MKKINFEKIKDYKVRPIPAILTILIVIGIPYYIINNNSISNNIEKVSQDLESANQKISDIETVLVATQEENISLAEIVAEAEEKSKSLERQFDKVNDNVEDLEKITNTDPELLQKYSQVYFLNEHYAPSGLEKIPSKWTYNKDRTYKVHEDVWPFLEKLLERADRDGIDLQVISAFRSFGEQSQLKGSYTVSYGAGSANQFSADQGYSEHQLGTTVDFTTTSVGSTFSGFAQTPEYKWLLQNADKYGFTLSYPENNSFYQFEPWHWRFVGEKLADDLVDDDQHFYDLGQREIDEYTIYLFD